MHPLDIDRMIGHTVLEWQRDVHDSIERRFRELAFVATLARRDIDRHLWLCECRPDLAVLAPPPPRCIGFVKDVVRNKRKGKTARRLVVKQEEGGWRSQTLFCANCLNVVHDGRPELLSSLSEQIFTIFDLESEHERLSSPEIQTSLKKQVLQLIASERNSRLHGVLRFSSPEAPHIKTTGSDDSSRHRPRPTLAWLNLEVDNQTTSKLHLSGACRDAAIQTECSLVPILCDNEPQQNAIPDVLQISTNDEAHALEGHESEVLKDFEGECTQELQRWAEPLLQYMDTLHTFEEELKHRWLTPTTDKSVPGGHITAAVVDLKIDQMSHAMDATGVPKTALLHPPPKCQVIERRVGVHTPRKSHRKTTCYTTTAVNWKKDHIPSSMVTNGVPHDIGLQSSSKNLPAVQFGRVGRSERKTVPPDVMGQRHSTPTTLARGGKEKVKGFKGGKRATTSITGMPDPKERQTADKGASGQERKQASRVHRRRVEGLADSFVDEVVNEIAQELGSFCDSFVEHMYSCEFIMA